MVIQVGYWIGLVDRVLAGVVCRYFIKAKRMMVAGMGVLNRSNVNFNNPN